MEFKFAFSAESAKTVAKELSELDYPQRVEYTDIKGFIGNIVYVVTDKAGRDYLTQQGFEVD